MGTDNRAKAIGAGQPAMSDLGLVKLPGGYSTPRLKRQQPWRVSSQFPRQLNWRVTGGSDLKIVFEKGYLILVL